MAVPQQSHTLKTPKNITIQPDFISRIFEKEVKTTKNIVETAIEAGAFKTLITAVQTAGLAETLSSPGPFTVFAPTDAAFAKIPAETIQNLLKDKPKLTAVLTYHVVPGKVMAADVVKLKKAKTVQGQEITIDTTAGVKINNAKVTKTDIECTNGVIHIIDTVIMPPPTPMKKFIVNSAILPASMDPMACAKGIPEMLKKAGTKDVTVKSCYCCGPEGKVAFVTEAKSRESLLAALNKINLPVASIMEAEEVTQK